MRGLWSDEEATGWTGDIGQRIYTSRLLGRDRSLVLHGGGNTSVKISARNLFDEEETLLCVKGSGRDLERIESADFARMRLAPLLRLIDLPSISDTDLLVQLAASRAALPAPEPSLETLLHACLPDRYVDHTHADAVLAINDCPDGDRFIRDVYGDCCVIVPYRKPGFGLAKILVAATAEQRTEMTVGVVLLGHGIVSFGQTARESYERMIDLVSRAERWLAARGAWEVGTGTVSDVVVRPLAQARLRRSISDEAGIPMVLKTCTNARTLGFACHPSVARISQQGPVTPDHVIRTRRVPMLGTDAARYAEEMRRYFESHAGGGSESALPDPAPRLILDPAFGLAAAGRNALESRIAEEIYEHSIDIMLRAEVLGGFRSLPEKDIFEIETWALEQAKLAPGSTTGVFAGEVVIVTGAASGIGKAAAASFLTRGAAVVGLDVNAAVRTLHDTPAYLGIACDLTDGRALAVALDEAVLRFGGIDMLVLNAGIFPASHAIAELDSAEWRRVMSINLDANFALLHAAHAFLKLAPRGGRVVVIGSKNVPAPGPGAAAYSASKAALNQLARVAALEWGSDRIRVNSLHPNAVFDTGLWSEEILARRARHYGMTVDQYRTNNVLRVDVTSRDVAELAAEMCGPLFAKTTGAQVPVDGGNERVI